MAVERSNRATRVLEQLAALLSTMKDAETSQRGSQSARGYVEAAWLGRLRGLAEALGTAREAKRLLMKSASSYMEPMLVRMPWNEACPCRNTAM